MSWRDVFDCSKLGFSKTKLEYISIVESVGYKFFAFNGMVYSIDDIQMCSPICSVQELG